ncbi:tRNA (5-methylaminomethyl-2-thiouridine)(34)-methyltransferase MnmD [bacterium SCSIO 12741]|nr:tRNA (5-methylaminomethyl-2-thiouridine)(34)-methyltransferase MnmD [bacterium SCSIO 12741]
MPLEIIESGDGSHSLYHTELDETYHSRHGSIQEALHVFLKSGLDELASLKEVRIFEMGFGTGLNALLTAREAPKRDQQITYFGLERYPVEESIWQKLNYTEQLEEPELSSVFENLHQSSWEQPERINSHFILQKMEGDIRSISLPEPGHLIYFDAFGPRVQPELWDATVFERLLDWLLPGGILVTYSCKGDVKRALKQVGFEVEKIPGPPGKREMLRARKPQN